MQFLPNTPRIYPTQPRGKKSPKSPRHITPTNENPQAKEQLFSLIETAQEETSTRHRSSLHQPQHRTRNHKSIERFNECGADWDSTKWGNEEWDPEFGTDLF